MACMAVSTFLKGVFNKKPQAESTLKAAAEDTRFEIVENPKVSRQQSEAAFLNFLINDSHREPLSVPQKLVLEIVQENLSKADYRQNAIPRLPMVIPKLLRSLRDPDSSAKDYVEIVNKDPVMSAAVLKLANSVYFNPIGTYIGDIERAIVKLGIAGIRSVLSAAVMQPIVQRESPYFSQTGQRLWAHSLNCAVTCDIAGQKRGLEQFKVYLMGLMHDIGKMTLFSELCKQYKLNGDQKPGYKAFVPMLRRRATVLSYLIAKDWQLPEEICTALEEQIDITNGKLVSPYGQLLFQANIATELYAVSNFPQRQKLEPILEFFNLPTDLYSRLDQISKQV